MREKVVLVLALLSFAVTPALAVDGQIKIGQTSATTFPIVIDKSGSYVLTSNLVAPDYTDAIKIEVNDVTLDLNGHTIQGNDKGCHCAVGIQSVNRYTITVKNGKIWGFHYGIQLLGQLVHDSYKSAGHVVRNVQAPNNSIGIEVYGGLVVDCVANNNSYAGIRGYNSTIRNCTANLNEVIGIKGQNCTIASCTANYNVSDGINVGNSIVTSCNTFNNGNNGIAANNSLVQACNARSNTNGGIHGYTNTYVFRCAAGGNGSFQINCTTCSNNALY